MKLTIVLNNRKNSISNMKSESYVHCDVHRNIINIIIIYKSISYIGFIVPAPGTIIVI